MVLAHNVHASSSADAVSTFDVRFLINGMRPENYSFFWVLGITTKTFRVATEILSDVSVIKAGDRSGNQGNHKAEHAEHLSLLWADHAEGTALITLQKCLNREASSAQLSVMLPLFVCRWFADCGLSATLFPQAGLGFIEAENFFPLAEELKDFLDDPLAFVTDTPVAADITSAPAAAVVAPVKMESKEGS